MKNIVFIAPHGTGKGTQCNLLKEKYGYIPISTGEIIRARIKKQDILAKQLEETINEGKLVSDKIVLDMLENFINENNLQDKIIFDGYPRTLAQAQALDDLMKKLNQKIDLVIYLEISKEEALKRTLGRQLCPQCQRSYNKFYDYLKPINTGICDNCHCELVGRNDDTKEAFNHLFDIFLKDTYPILEYYQDKNILIKIDANQPYKQIFKRIEESL